MNLKYKELRREAPRRNIMESKHTEAAPPEGRRTVWTPFQIHCKGLLIISIQMTLGTIQNDYFDYETCLRHIRNHPTTENYFLRLHFRKLPPENE